MGRHRTRVRWGVWQTDAETDRETETEGDRGAGAGASSSVAGRVGWADAAPAVNWMNLTSTGGRSRRGTRAAAAGPASGHRRGPGAAASGQGRAGVAAREAPRTAGSLTGFYFSGAPARKDVSHGEAGVQPHAVGGAPPSAAPLATSCDLGACAAWPPVSPPGPRRPRLVLRAFASMAGSPRSENGDPAFADGNVAFAVRRGWVAGAPSLGPPLARPSPADGGHLLRLAARSRCRGLRPRGVARAASVG